jgi:HECT-domain (ubiquitin-transferase)
LAKADASTRIQFLRFVTGRDCVPPQAEDWPFTISVQEHYKYLPVAYTCVSTLYIARVKDRDDFLRRFQMSLASSFDFDLG